MDISVNRLTNANIYIDGIGLLGRAEEIEVSQPRHRMADHKALGMAGTAEFWAGVDKLEAKIKWASVYPEALPPPPHHSSRIRFRCVGSLEQYTSQGRNGGIARSSPDDWSVQRCRRSHISSA